MLHPLPAPISRRQALRQCAVGFGDLAFAELLTRSGVAATKGPLQPRPPHFAARARRIIFLFMHGGPSHVDTFDYKPALTRDAGKPLPFEKPRVQFAKTGDLRPSPWQFRPFGQSEIGR